LGLVFIEYQVFKHYNSSMGVIVIHERDIKNLIFNSIRRVKCQK